MSALAPTLQSFFTERLTRQRQASPRTVASYRDTFLLLVSFVERETGKAPSALGIEDLSASLGVSRRQGDTGLRYEEVPCL
jgi:site-specific recombinase XerC